MPPRKKKPRALSPVDTDTLRRTRDWCEWRYNANPDVIGVGLGLKFAGGVAGACADCLHFYVRRKVWCPVSSRRLPRFVQARLSSGKADRTRRISTDVIALRNLGFACKSGSEIGVIGESGTATLLFRNKAPKQRDSFLITCAHVAGDVRSSPPVDPRITHSRNGSASVLATTLVNATEHGGALDYDIALARIAAEHLPVPECRVSGSAVRLNRFLPTDELRAGMRVECAFPASNVVAAIVASGRVSLPLTLDGREVRVNNLFLIDQPPRLGDSGGLLYSGSAAVGILVGKADGWGLFQPLGEAFAHLQELSVIPLQCFNKTKKPKENKTCSSSQRSA